MALSSRALRPVPYGIAPRRASMLGAFAALLLFQLVGELTVRSLGLPFPGPVVGLVLLFVALMIRGGVPEPLRAVSTTLLRHLMLLLVPATTAVILHGQRL